MRACGIGGGAVASRLFVVATDLLQLDFCLSIRYIAAAIRQIQCLLPATLPPQKRVSRPPQE